MRVIALPVGEKDLSDYFDAGGTAEQLRALIEQQPSPVLLPAYSRLKPGGAIFDTPTESVALVGEGDEILFALDEPNEIYGGSGVGKTTIAQQIILSSIGIREPVFLGLPVAPRNRWLALVMDRPAQFKRSLRRMVSEEDRPLLDEKLVIHDGPLDFDVGQEPDRLLALALEVGADAVLIDSIKDMAGDIEKTVGGQGVNRAHQLLISNGIAVIALHHPRKSQVGNNKPNKLDDVYGSRFITDGMGSVVLLWGEPGDAVIELTHLKQPRDSVGPWTLIHDHATGTTTRDGDVDAYTIITASNGISAEGIARQLFKTDKPTRAQVENARRKARAVVARDYATEKPGQEGGAGSKPAYFFKKALTESTHTTHGHSQTHSQPLTQAELSESDSTHENTHTTHGFTHDSGGLYRETPDVSMEDQPESCWTCGGPLDSEWRYEGEEMHQVCSKHVRVMA